MPERRQSSHTPSGYFEMPSERTPNAHGDPNPGSVDGDRSCVQPVRRVLAPREGDQICSLDASLVDLVDAVRALPYGRPSDRTVEGMLRERRGTCSTKHLFLARTLAERFPETEPLVVHRVYGLDRAGALKRYGKQVAQTVPENGVVVDVHRYLTLRLDGQRITIDATFPGPRWDGRSPLPLACGPGDDHPAGEDPDAEKRELEGEHCDPATREPFIRALATTHLS